MDEQYGGCAGPSGVRRPAISLAVDPKHELSVLANLLRTVPTYRLFLSEDRELNPRAVEHAIARAAAA